MTKRVDLEGPIHRSIVSYLRAVLPADAIIHHSPNEGNRGGRKGVIDGQHRKAMGVQPGFPDILIFVQGQGYCLEVKSAAGRLSPIQERVRDTLLEQGIPYAVVRSVDDVRDLLCRWGVKTRDAA